MESKQYQEIEIDKIVIPEDRARATFNQDQYNELKASIKEHGFNVPILVRPLADGRYELIDGEHRIQIVKEMGWTKIPAIVTTTDEKRASILNFLANTARGTQDPIDISRAINKSLAAGATIEEVAAATGHTKEWVEFYKLLSELPEHYQQALKDGRLNVTVVKEAFRLPTWEETDKTLMTALNLGWSGSVVKHAVDMRLREIELAKEREKELEKPEPLPEYNPEQLAQYETCMFCKRTVRKDTTYMEIICQDCRYLLRYILQYIPDPKQAMEFFYEALLEKKEREQYEQLKKKFEGEKPMPPQAGSPERPPGTSSWM